MQNANASMISCLGYRDPNAAVEWLCRAFGFQEHAVYKGEDGQVMHAELSFGNGMVMLGGNKGPLGPHMRVPSQLDGLCTQIVYIIVDDADAHYAQAKAAGAEIVTELKNEDYGGRDYSCRDPEGHIWSFGTYNPWTAPAAA